MTQRAEELSAVVCVNSCYPSYSETFVARELAELRGAGIPVYSYSIQTPPGELRAEVPYICAPRSAHGMFPWLVLALLRSPRQRRRPRLRRVTGLRGWLRRLLVDAHSIRLRRALVRLGCSTVVHAHFLAHTAEVALGASEDVSPVVVTVHAADGDLPRSDEHERFLTRLAGIRFASEAVRATLRSTFPEVDGPVIPCVALLPSPRPDHRPEEQLRITTVGRLVATKGYRAMMAAVEEAARRGRVRWTIIGDGPLMDDLKSWSADHSPGLEVNLRGALPHHLALEALDDADVFMLLPEGVPGDVRRGDGLPVALMEAMARGVPVVTTDVGGIAELVHDGSTGVIIRQGDVDAAVAALWGAGRTDESARIIDAGQRAVRATYSPCAVVPRLRDWLGTVESASVSV